MNIVKSQTGAITAQQAISGKDIVLKHIRENGAPTLGMIAVPYLINGLEIVCQNPVLKYNFEGDIPVWKAIYSICLDGDSDQRSIVGASFSSNAALFFPGVWAFANASFEARQQTIDALSAFIDDMCNHFGVAFQGNKQSVCNTLISEVGGLSFLDFLIFTERVKAGRYQTRYQVVNTRGINGEFLLDWIRSYMDEREADQQEAYEKYSKPSAAIDAYDEVRSMFSALDPETISRQIISRAQMDKRVAEIVSDWQTDLYESVLIETWFKEVWSDSVVISDTGERHTKKVKDTVVCASSDPDRKFSQDMPARIATQEGVKKMLKRAIHHFVTCDITEDTNRIYIEFLKHCEKKGYDIQAKSKQILIAIPHLIRKDMKSVDILHAHYAAQIDQIAQDQYTDQDEIKIKQAKYRATQDRVWQTIRKITSVYYDEYLPERIEKKYPAMSLHEYTWALSLDKISHSQNPVTLMMFE